MKRSCALLLMAALALGFPAAAEAQPLTAGPEILVAPVGFQPGGWEALLAVGPDGGILNSWIYDGPLKIRAVSPAGDPLGTTRQLSAGFQNPTVAQLAALGPGRFAAVWSARLAPSPPVVSSVVARIVDSTGNPITSTHRVLADEGVVLDVAADGTGGFFVAWHVIEAAEVRIGRFDGEGNPAGAEVAIGAVRLQGLTAALLPGGGAVLTWFSRGGFNGEPPQEISLRVVQPDGTSAGGISLISQLATGDVLTFPQVSADAAGRFVVAWADLDRSTGRSRVQARRFAADGEPLGAAILAGETGLGLSTFSLDVAVRPDGSFLILWGEQGDVLVRHFDAAGNPLGAALRVHDAEEGEQHPGAAAATADGWAVSWGRSLDAQAGLYNRRFALSCGTAAGLCLQDRFLATVEWHVPATGARGQGTPVSRTSDTGTFWFFDPANLELVVKVLDGTGINGHFWVFYGSLTDVEFKLTVTDRLTGRQRIYQNPAGTLASHSDTQAFPQ